MTPPSPIASEYTTVTTKWNSLDFGFSEYLYTAKSFVINGISSKHSSPWYIQLSCTKTSSILFTLYGAILSLHSFSVASQTTLRSKYGFSTTLILFFNNKTNCFSWISDAVLACDLNLSLALNVITLLFTNLS